MEAHPQVGYRDALRALLNAEKAQERETRQEFDRRVEHQMNAGYKGYELAAERVLLSDPGKMAMPYADATDQAGLARRVGELMAAAKRAAGIAKVPLQDAVRQILEGQRDTAKRVAGDWMDHRARIEINNMNLGSSVDRAYSIALRIVMRTYPEVRQMYETGTVSELAMRTIFRQWFK